MGKEPVSRRSFLRGSAALGAGVALGGCGIGRLGLDFADGPRRHGRVRQPGSLPNPRLPEGVDTLPQIEHVVVLMMENHSFDNVLGMVSHQVPGRRSVDGLRVVGGKAVDSNPDAHGNPVSAFHASSPCQLPGEPSQTWNASHEAYDNGLNDGFVKASAPVAMEFWNKRDLPFT
ncbi:MAG: twin-arginine translocation signal domain-containing protein, partial [Actinobacteria bacterium]|nr:twin-arginine translocation signal domain-containing protein [Actinomycetota bacterium]